MNFSVTRVLVFSLLTILLTSISIEVGSVFMGTASLGGRTLGSHALSIPVFWAFLVLLFFCVVLKALVRIKLLTRAELLCVLFAGLMASPIITVGFWRFAIPNMMAYPRAENFVGLDAMNPNLWPHGPNLTEGVLTKSTEMFMDTQGSVQWNYLTLSNGQIEQAPLIEHTSKSAKSRLRVYLPVGDRREDTVIPGQNYLISVLVRAEGLTAGSHYYCRLYNGQDARFLQEAFSSSEEAEVTFQQKDGYRRNGTYGVVLPVQVKDSVILELGLNGTGQVVFRDLQVMNVEAIESAYRGRTVLREKDLKGMTDTEKANRLIEPGNLFSFAGIHYLLTAYIPWRDWLRPLASWGAFLILTLAAPFAIAAIMRREWIDHQRLPLPFAQIPAFFLGSKTQETDTEPFLPDGWHNRFMWAGFAVTFIWCLLRGFHEINSSIPNLDINLRLNAYIENPYFQRMLAGLNLEVIALYLGMAMFLELNVLMSLLAGFFLYRAQFLVGEFYGLTYQAGFPYQLEQRLSGFIVYSILIVFFSRKYIYRFLRTAVKGVGQGEEVLSSRQALLLLVASTGGIALWAKIIGMPVGGTLINFLVLLSIGLVAMRLRADCAVPGSVMFPHMYFFVAFAGGIAVIGDQGVMFAAIISVVLVYFGFLIIPGMQLEFLELGRRYGIKRGTIFLVNIVAVGGGFLIGGWIVLSGIYSNGMDSFPDAHYYAKGPWDSHYYILNSEAATDAPQISDTSENPKIRPATWAVIYTGGLVSLVTFLRHSITGFWLHPGGIVLGSTWVMYHVWASLFVACLARYSVLKFGGAATVREKLLPFAAGIFLAAITAQGFFFIINLFLFYVADSTQLQFDLL